MRVRHPACTVGGEGQVVGQGNVLRYHHTANRTDVASPPSLTAAVQTKPDLRSMWMSTSANATRPPHDRSKSRLPALSVEKHPFAGADCQRLNVARAPFLTGFSRLLRGIKLGSVDVHLSQSIVAAIEMKAEKLVSVLQ